eukprot:TRINITY_DN1688_c2_g1_i1.p1 TRINITY_DN1688_c2_g1~~TRINITY_DN1688_c2_g1_i1.p1  ORF type:complete len:612 (+),score=85.06 TRINITY_DN1688_c2_g1_i1:27-1862(+)
MPGKKKKGPDPAAIQAEQAEVARLTREFYLKAYRKEHAKSAGHRTTHKESGVVPGFDPQPYPDIENEKLDRLITRRSQKAAWGEGDDDGVVVVGEDRDASMQQDFSKSAQHDVNECLYQVMATVDGIENRSEMEATDEDITQTFEAIDQDSEFNASRDLGMCHHTPFPRPEETIDMVSTLTALWERKSSSILQELCNHLKISTGQLSLLTTAIACRYLPANPKLTYIELLTLFLYTCEPVGLDRLLGRWSGHTPPFNYAPVSPNIMVTINRAIAARDLKVMGEWVNFILIIASASTSLPADKVGRTLYYGVKSEAMTHSLRSFMKNCKPDDVQYWPAVVSASLDMDLFISEEHDMVATIRGVRSGLDLTNCSQSPQQMEIVLPPFSVVRVKTKTDNRKIEVHHVGSVLTGDLADIPEQWRARWTDLVNTVKNSTRKTSTEIQLLQFYQRAHRQLVNHKETLTQLTQLISQAEAENEATLMVTDRSRTGAAAKNNASSKPEDPLFLLDGHKAALLETHLQWTRFEQSHLERELRALKTAISEGTEDLLRTESEGLLPDPSLRPLLKLQTEHYNELVNHYDSGSRRCEEVQNRVTALKPADTSRKGGKKPKKT